MSSTAFIVPVDLQSSASQTIPNLDPVKLWATGPSDGKTAKVGTTRIFYNTPAQNKGSDVTALTSLGENFASAKGDARRELVRKAVGSAVKSVTSLGDGVKKVSIDASADDHAAGKILHSSHSEFLLSSMSSRRCSLGSVQVYVENGPTISFQARPRWTSF
jgi:aminopeptidase